MLQWTLSKIAISTLNYQNLRSRSILVIGWS